MKIDDFIEELSILRCEYDDGKVWFEDKEILEVSPDVFGSINTSFEWDAIRDEKIKSEILTLVLKYALTPVNMRGEVRAVYVLDLEPGYGGEKYVLTETDEGFLELRNHTEVFDDCFRYRKDCLFSKDNPALVGANLKPFKEIMVDVNGYEL